MRERHRRTREVVIDPEDGGPDEMQAIESTAVINSNAASPAGSAASPKERKSIELSTLSPKLCVIGRNWTSAIYQISGLLHTTID